MGGFGMNLYEGLKDATNLALKAKQLPLYEKLLGLTADMQTLMNENFELKKKVRDLEEAASLQKRMEYDPQLEAFYEIEENGTKNGPYCPACWQEHKRVVFLRVEDDGETFCQVCRGYIHIIPSKPDQIDYSKQALDW
jgi:CRISPR/Cas system-associated protein Cas10 (large subunit of type III CRISPR-Cas system)